MSDIVERLRHWPAHEQVRTYEREMQQAADTIEAQAAEIARLREALFDAIALIGHIVPMDATVVIGGKKRTALVVWQAGYALLFPKRAALKGADNATGD